MGLRYSKERCDAPNNVWLTNKNMYEQKCVLWSDVLVLVRLGVNKAKPRLVRVTESGG